MIFEDNSEPIGVLLAVLVVFATGFLDDIRDMAPPGKVTGVVSAGIVLSYFGVDDVLLPGPVLRRVDPVERLDTAGHRALAAR